MFPDDVWLIIVKYLSNHRDICRVSMVCSQVYFVANDDEVWIDVCKRSFTANEYERQRAEGWCSWKTAYAIRTQVDVERKVIRFIQEAIQKGGAKVDPKPLAKLIKLDLSKTCVGSEGAAKLGVALKGNKALECIDLSNQLMKDVTLLVDALVTMKKLATINLSSNRLGPHGAQNIHRLLTSSPALTRLVVTDNFFSPTGASVIATALPTKPVKTPLHLNLDYNQIGDQGVTSILPASLHLASLSLRDNGITSASFATIVDFVRNAPSTFAHLDLSNTPAHPNKKSPNKFKSSHRKALAEIAAEKPTLTLTLPLTDKKHDKGCKCM